jgi:hypothetical protein
MPSSRSVYTIDKASVETTNLIEVDIHALQLKIRGSIVPGREVSSTSLWDFSRCRMIYSHARSIETVLAGDGLPIFVLDIASEHACACQGYRPEGSTDLITLIEVRFLFSNTNEWRTYALSGLEMDL